jgi:aminoglycoside phosphotransferase family enzyme/predicted kinase
MTQPAPGHGGIPTENLLAPEAYPHPVATPVRLAETHISRVFLTGEFAYKFKKPVRLAFLDYSTLERRRTFCEDEVRLNRRYAPDLYLGVSAIAGPLASPRVDGAGAAIEYAVKMRQFDQREELDVLVDAGGVAASDLSALGTRLAQFHAAAGCVDSASPFGRPDAVQRVTLANFEELRRLPEAAARAEIIADLERWIAGEFARVGDLMQSRRDSGRVRECHGDLHCGNVVRWAGALTPFDGIEFDPALRYVDVASDLAFLTMDLSVRGRDDLRRAALQAWAETLGDFEAIRLLPYFETYRALVRAKVAALRALQHPVGSSERARDCEAAFRYLDWASARTRRARPALLLTCGYSGSGKTWLARTLAGDLHALHLRSDVERKRLAGLGSLDDSQSPQDGGIYTPEYTRRTYDRLHDSAADVLGGGESVIVDAAFLKRDERERMLDLADRLEVHAAILHCTAPMDVLRERVAGRSRNRTDASEAGVATLERQPGYWEPLGVRESARTATVDTNTHDPVAVCREALQRLAIGLRRS